METRLIGAVAAGCTKPPAPVDPEHYPGAIGPLPRAIRRPLDPVGGAFAHPQRHRGD